MAEPIAVHGMTGEQAQRYLEAVSARLPRVSGELGNVTIEQLFAVAVWLLSAVFLADPHFVLRLDPLISFFVEVNSDMMTEAGVDPDKLVVMVPHFTFPESKSTEVDVVAKETVH